MPPHAITVRAQAPATVSRLAAGPFAWNAGRRGPAVG